MTIFRIFPILFFILIGTAYSQEGSPFNSIYKPIIEELIKTDLDSAKTYITSILLKTPEKNHLELGELYHYLAITEKRLQKNYKALEYLNKGLAQKKLTNNKESISNTYNLIGTIHHKNGDLDKALSFYLKAINLLKDSASIYQTSPRLNISRLYLDLNEFEKAKEELENTELFLKLNNDTAETPTIENLWGILYQNTGNIDSAKIHYQKYLDYNLKNGTKSSRANGYNNMAIIYFYEGNLKRSYKHFKKAYAYRVEAKDTIAQLASLSNLGDFYLELNNLDSALFFYTKGLKLSIIKKSDIDTRDFYAGISKINEKLNQPELALENYKNFIEYNKKAVRNKNLKRIEELEAKYNFKQQENRLKNSKKTNLQLVKANKIINIEKQKARNLNTLLLIVTLLLGLALIAVLYVLYSNKKLAKTLQQTAISKDEKETLIKEIHHRVKNNLQIITSLLRLQAATIEDEKTSSYFIDCERRVAAMALVHEKLYKSNNFSAINLAEYIDELVRNLIASFASTFPVIKNTNIEVEELDLDTIIPVSLIINECITNSFKHGYSPRIENFTITCFITYKNKREIHLLIGDNGVGFPDGFSLANENSLGVELIDSLINQIDGTIEIINENGAYYNIIFPINTAEIHHE